MSSTDGLPNSRSFTEPMATVAGSPSQHPIDVCALLIYDRKLIFRYPFDDLSPSGEPLPPRPTAEGGVNKEANAANPFERFCGVSLESLVQVLCPAVQSDAFTVGHGKCRYVVFPICLHPPGEQSVLELHTSLVVAVFSDSFDLRRVRQIMRLYHAALTREEHKFGYLSEQAGVLREARDHFVHGALATTASPTKETCDDLDSRCGSVATMGSITDLTAVASSSDFHASGPALILPEMAKFYTQYCRGSITIGDEIIQLAKALADPSSFGELIVNSSIAVPYYGTSAGSNETNYRRRLLVTSLNVPHPTAIVAFRHDKSVLSFPTTLEGRYRDMLGDAAQQILPLTTVRKAFAIDKNPTRLRYGQLRESLLALTPDPEKLRTSFFVDHVVRFLELMSVVEIHEMGLLFTGGVLAPKVPLNQAAFSRQPGGGDSAGAVPSGGQSASVSNRLSVPLKSRLVMPHETSVLSFAPPVTERGDTCLPTFLAAWCEYNKEGIHKRLKELWWSSDVPDQVARALTAIVSYIVLSPDMQGEIVAPWPQVALHVSASLGVPHSHAERLVSHALSCFSDVLVEAPVFKHRVHLDNM